MNFAKTSAAKRFNSLGIDPPSSPQEATAVVMTFYKSHLKKPEFQDEFMNADVHYPQYADRTDVYACQTEDNNFIKFGIAQSHAARARGAGTNEKDRYAKYLYHITTNTRYEAETVERLLKHRLYDSHSSGNAKIKSYSVEVTEKSEREVISAIDKAWDEVQAKGVLEIRKSFHESMFKYLWRLAKRVHKGLAFVHYSRGGEYIDISRPSAGTKRIEARDELQHLHSFKGFLVTLEDTMPGTELEHVKRAYKKDAISVSQALDEWKVDASEFKGF